MLLSVVVVNWNSSDDLRACLASLRAQTHRELTVIVVDNGSTDGSVELLRREFPEVMLLAQTENLGFAEACNLGIAASHSEWVAMLNNDAVARPEWAAALVDAARHAPASCGMLQSLLLFLERPGTINSTGIELLSNGSGRDRDGDQPFVPGRDVEEIFCPTAGAAAYRRAMLEAIKLPGGYFDRAHFMYYEDMDLGWRARLAGWSASYVPSSVVHHRVHGSTVRHGKSWLNVIASTNRIRTLLKNASLPLLLRTGPESLKEIARVAKHGGVSGLRGLSLAVRDSLITRSSISAMAQRERRAVERDWRLGSAS